LLFYSTLPVMSSPSGILGPDVAGIQKEASLCHREQVYRQLGTAAGKQALGLPDASATCKGFHLAWPTEEDVRGSMVGWCNGKALPAAHRNVSKPCLQAHMSRWDAGLCNRQRLTPHMKSYCRCALIKFCKALIICQSCAI
jgi:hypothetical protein